jgi:adenine-specific DNA methylase
LGYKTITNDFLNFNNQIGLALIENVDIKLNAEDLRLLFQPAKNKREFELIENTFTNVFFEKEEARFLDNFRANITMLENPIKQALAFMNADIMAQADCGANRLIRRVNLFYSQFRHSREGGNPECTRFPPSRE